MQLKRILRPALACMLSGCIFSGMAGALAAENITRNVTVTTDGAVTTKLTDSNLGSIVSGEPLTIDITSKEPMGGIYIKYRYVPGAGTLNGNVPIAKNGFMQEWIPLDSPTNVHLAYENAAISEIEIYSEGEKPDNVPDWQVGEVKTDLMLFATHSDDDQLFFAGLLPYYAVREDVNIRVAYFINHYDTFNRTHELLDGLWHCGVTNYPDISPFPDGYSESAEDAKSFLEEKGFTSEEIVAFPRSLLNQYTPKVTVLHDIKGEYGHGAHMLNTAAFFEACRTRSDTDYIPEKIYIHLSEEYPLVLDIDTPLEALGGKSPFAVSQEAFGFHTSQHWTWFYDWMYGKDKSITLASEISSYNPAKYGLYFCRVPADITSNDMLDGVETYAAVAQKESEQQRLLEEEMRQAEEARLEAERIENETRIAAAKEALRAAEQKRMHDILLCVAFLFGVVAIGLVILIVRYIRRKRSERYEKDWNEFFEKH